MIRKDNRSEQGAELRRQAEEIILGKTDPMPENPESMTLEEIRRQLHELRAHQIELEMQNEELRSMQAKLDIAQAHYFDLFSLAPVGYFILSEQGLILESNHFAATLLGPALSKLIKQPITRFILNEDQDIYYRLRKQLFETGEQKTCELRMVKKDGTTFWGHLSESILQKDDSTHMTCIVLIDMTERGQSEEKIRSQLTELQRWQDVMLDREDREQELKREVNELCRRTGEAVRYPNQAGGLADSWTEETES